MSAGEQAKERLAAVLDDTRGFHVYTLDSETREAFLQRLLEAVTPAKPAKSSDNISRSAQAFIEEGEIVIRVLVDALPNALEGNPRDFGGEHNYFAKHINDLPAFAKDVVTALNDEDEDGSTLVHLLFDDAMAKAIDNGSEGIDYRAAERTRKARDK